MTSKPAPQEPPSRTDDQFPVFLPRSDMQNSIYLDKPAHQAALSRHFGKPDTTIILSEIPVNLRPSQRRDHRIPDLLVAFNVSFGTAIGQRGYAILEQGKPPDFVLEVASLTTGRNDYREKRVDYAAFGIPEYWRFDPSGGRYHDAPLAGDRLVGDAYQPIPVVQSDATHHWGHSEVLGLHLCWEESQLRWWDPAARRYLPTYDEIDEERVAALGRAEDAEARIRELEARLRDSQ